MKPRVYRYIAIDKNDRVNGLLIAKSRTEAINIVYSNGLRVISIKPLWLYIFNRTAVVNWFGSLHDLLNSGFSLSNALLLVRDEGVSLNILNCLRIGKSFGEAIHEQSLFFGPDSSFIAINLGSHVQTMNLCKFLEGYNLFILKSSQEVSSKIFMPLIGLVLCVSTLFVILYLLISNLDLVLMFTETQTTLAIRLLLFIEKIGLYNFFFIFCTTCFLGFRLIVLKSRFFREYFLNKEVYFIFYLISEYLAHGIHLSECFKMLKPNIGQNQLYQEIEFLKKNLNAGNSLYSGFQGCEYLSKYSKVVHIYESCGKINSELFNSLSKMEKSELTRKMSFMTKAAPIVVFVMSSTVVLLTCSFVLFGFKLDFIMR